MIRSEIVKGLAFLIILIPLLTGCSLEDEIIPIDQNTPTMKIEKLSGEKLSFSHDIAGNKITTSYDLTGYKLENWRITDSKSINITLGATNIKKGTEILVEHMHADVSIKSTDPQINGMTQDTMDNSYHGTSQDGFLITEKHPYVNIFAIEGFSKDLISGWSFYAGDFGSGSISSRRLTEGNLLKAGTYGSQLSIIWNLLVKDAEQQKYHIETFEDRIIIPTMALIQAENQASSAPEKGNK